MKQRVLNRFIEHCYDLPDEPSDWLAYDDVLSSLMETGHYQALIDVGMPAGHVKSTGRITALDEARFQTMMYMRKVERKWIQKKIHDCMGMKELEECILMEIGSLKQGYSDALTFIKEYYSQLRTSISNTLYYSKGVFEREELELMVPHVESPFYDREMIIQHYLTKISKTKPPGHREAISKLENH